MRLLCDFCGKSFFFIPSMKPQVIILGAGPAGLGAAYQLARRDLAQVTVIERNSVVGGNAGSFDLAGMRVDYGSHRLHPACDPIIFRDIREMLKGDLLDMPRHGRIRLRGHWIHFPLKPLDLALKLPPGFALGVAGDFLGKFLPLNSNGAGPDTFSSILERGLGRTICRDFYFPYARKLWGVEPAELSATQARRRVSAGSLAKMVRKVLSAAPGFKPTGSGRFYYPRFGYGQICEAYYEAAKNLGVTFLLKANLLSVEIRGDRRVAVGYEQNDKTHTVDGEYVWSTIPITSLASQLTPVPPSDYLESEKAIDYRAMILIYMVLEQDQFTEYDAHYFPEKQIRISRLSEPKNYSASREPRNRTVLCAELPCSTNDPEWGMSDQELGELMRDALASAGLPVRAPVSHVTSRRLRQAYPIYWQGYEHHFNRLDQWLGRINGLLTFGRQGLFAHDNTHHALYMAYAAVDCLDSEGRFDYDRWRDFRRIFETHVVED
jgi:protoporphyrinogen oxidase